MSSDLANGSTTVKADGGNMIAIKGCEFSRCTGDEAGTAGGVKSGTFGKEAKFILYSFDVKIEGQNACRLADKMTMNHENTMCLGGVVEVPTIVGSSPEEKIACAIWCCDTEGKYNQKAKGKKAKDCQRLGSKKHSCVHKALSQQSQKGVISGQRFTPDNPKFFASKELLKAAGRKVKGKIVPRKWLTPDTLYQEGGKWKIIDAKFPCPERKPGEKGFTKTGRIKLQGESLPGAALPDGMGTPKEEDVYPKLKVDGQDMAGNVKTMTPAEAQATKSNDCTCKPAQK
jgi:hypothetical protein